MQELSIRSERFTDSVIRRMTRICDEYGAINLSQGFPDDAPPVELTNRLAEVAADGPHQYAVTWGAENFRNALAKKFKNFSGITIDPQSEVLVTCGSTEAMIAAVMTVCNPGDRVAVFSPFYENYGADAILCGAEAIYVPMRPPSFDFDADALEKAFASGAKALILCNPSNPSGKVFSLAELETIARLAEKYDAFVITDEVYEHIVFEPYQHIYFASLPGMFERTIMCGSLSKTYHITGWRLGYIIAPTSVVERAKKVHDFLTVGAASPLQEAATIGLEFADSYYTDLRTHYTEKRDFFLSGLDKLGIKHTNPQGAYYVLVDISEFGYESDMDFCIDLAQKVGVGAVPGSAFFNEEENRYIRLHFAKSEKMLSKALQRLASLPERLGQRNPS
ncbi:pyridoxal phosphate-dependent aminotransferase [Arcanobacterium ihumii]|uniref:pyridoxal phosphate-dependent aminotransferase n=1 Tax=Arcanobacterium ihumii TaxID=2138162 RepID=UPI000F52322F|nr:pyridoxal phosphate-dependent aminotransferase [Arcanobacterium ihumii]